MSLPREAMELWAKFVGETFRRFPMTHEQSQKLWRKTANKQKVIEQWAETWLKAGGLVPRSRYLEVLDEKERLRRRVAELEAKLGVEPGDRHQTSPTMDSVFDDMMAAQKRWLETWMPGAPQEKKD